MKNIFGNFYWNDVNFRSWWIFCPFDLKICHLVGRYQGCRPWGCRGSPNYGRSVNPISTRGGRLCPHINTGPLIFKLSYGPAKWLTEPCIRNRNATEVIRLIYVQLWKEYKLQNLLRKSRQIAKVLSFDAMLALHGWQCTAQRYVMPVFFPIDLLLWQ